MDHTIEIDRVYIYISRKRQFTDVSRARLSRLFRNTWPSKFHAAICSPSRNHFSLRSRAIRGDHLLFREVGS